MMLSYSLILQTLLSLSFEIVAVRGVICRPLHLHRTLPAFYPTAKLKFDSCLHLSPRSTTDDGRTIPAVARKAAVKKSPRPTTDDGSAIPAVARRAAVKKSHRLTTDDGSAIPAVARKMAVKKSPRPTTDDGSAIPAVARRAAVKKSPRPTTDDGSAIPAVARRAAVRKKSVAGAMRSGAMIIESVLTRVISTRVKAELSRSAVLNAGEKKAKLGAQVAKAPRKTVKRNKSVKKDRDESVKKVTQPNFALKR